MKQEIDKKSIENIMGVMEEKALIFKMALPMIFSVLVSSLYSIVDSIFIGRISDKALFASILQALTLIGSAYIISNILRLDFVWGSFIISEVCVFILSVIFMNNINKKVLI